MPQRESLAHRFLYYLYNNTSEKYQVWRNVTVDFFYNLHEIMSKNHGIVVYPYENDGIKIYYDQKDVAYLHIRQQWILFHANKEYLIYKSGDKIFLSKDGTRRLRFDLNNPKPHSNPHAHVEYKTGSNTWHKSGPLWPKDVIPK